MSAPVDFVIPTQEEIDSSPDGAISILHGSVFIQRDMSAYRRRQATEANELSSDEEEEKTDIDEHNTSDENEETAPLYAVLENTTGEEEEFSEFVSAVAGDEIVDQFDEFGDVIKENEPIAVVETRVGIPPLTKGYFYLR